MSRFTEHFDFDASHSLYSQTVSSPSKSSFLSMSSSESTPLSSPRLEINRQLEVDPLFRSFSSFNSDNVLSSTTSSFNSEEEKSVGGKLKRLLTTISKKKNSMPNHSQ